MFELLLLIKKMDNQFPGLICSYSYNYTFDKLEAASKMLRELKKFELVSYILHFNSNITYEDKKKLSMKAKTITGLPDSFNYMYKFEFDNSIKSILNFMNDSRIRFNETVALTQDYEGEKVINLLTADDIRRNVNISVKQKIFYVHYPHKTGSLVVFGNNEQGSMGVKTHQDVYRSIHPQIELDFVQIKSMLWHTFGLTKEKRLYICGTYNGIHPSIQFIELIAPGPIAQIDLSIHQFA
jgi:hypothetical protein